MGVVAAASAVVLGLAAPAPAGVADDRFDQIDGPLGAFVVRPEAFGVDASTASADVPGLLDEVDGARAFSFVEQLAFPRTADGPEQARQDARDLIAAELTDAGYDVQTEPVVLERTGIDSPNLYTELPGTECPEQTIVIGGHYDSEDPVGGGADDNATGVAGMVELARALQDEPLPATVRFASWSYEEEGLVGAFEMAGNLEADGRQVAGAISLEMLGYTEPDIDPLTGLPGTYLAMVADPTSAPLAKAFAAAAYTYAPEFPAFGAVIDPNVLPDILRSDHAAFLANGYPALMATDTANFRNPNYHQPTDTPDTLDPAFLTGSIRAALAGLATYASVDTDGDGTSDVCQGGTVVPPTTEPAAVPVEDPVAPPADAVAARPGYTG